VKYYYNKCLVMEHRLYYEKLFFFLLMVVIINCVKIVCEIYLHPTLHTVFK